MAGAPDLKSGDSKFKSRSRYVIPGFKPVLLLQVKYSIKLSSSSQWLKNMSKQMRRPIY